MSSSLNNEPDIFEAKSSRFSFGSIRFFLSQKRWYIFFGVFILGLLGLIGIIIYVEVYINSFDIRIDCNPDLPLDYENCQKRGCIWIQRKDSGQPPCFFPDGFGYHLKEKRNTSNGYNINLQRTPEKKIFGKEVNLVNLQVYFETPQRLRLKFVNATQTRYEVPIETPPPPAVSPKITNYAVEFVNEPQFGVIVKRKSTGTVIFDSNIPGMIFSDQFIQISTKLASSNIYGLGEHSSSEYKHSTNWKNSSFFARDIAVKSDTNLYGVHPFYMNLETDGNAHGVFFLNSNAMEVVLQPKPVLTFRSIGGILDFYIFMGSTPEDVVKQYLSVIGFPFMPPYWALGFHLSRFGYQSIDDVKTVVKRTIDANIPYDVQYFDIEYMDGFKDFTFDTKQYQSMPAVVDDLHQKNRKVVIILNPAISSNKSLNEYDALKRGINMKIFIRARKDNDTLFEGMVWPGKTYFIDFSHPEAESYWTKMCSDFRNIVPYDGLWLDMNEPANFADGSLTGCEKNSLNYPPYAAGVLGSKKDGKLFEKTLCMEAFQEAGIHYDVHNLYGFFQSKVTFGTLRKIIPQQRPFVLSRSTFPGSGKFAGHWLGDNFSTWPQMRSTIPGILEFSLYGIPYVGSDICGFYLNATQDLCLRWAQLGAFYPFSRNHNSDRAKDQDPAAFGKDFVDSVRRALLTRYELLPYLYTLFHLAHTEGSTVARPLLHEFPEDERTWNMNDEFLWGPALLISPILHENTDFVVSYIPKGVWYDFYSGEVVKTGQGKNIKLVDKGNIALFVRGGFILPLQKPDVTTAQSRKQPMGLFVAPNDDGSASGLLFWDDGVSLETQASKTYLLVEFKLRQDKEKLELNSTVVNNGYNTPSIQLGYVVLCSQSSPGGVQIEIEERDVKNVESSKWQYNSQTKVLRLENLESMKIQLTESFKMVIFYQKG